MQLKTKGLLIILFLSVFLNIVNAIEKLALADIFTDHMVLQRDVPVTVWGVAPGDDLINVFFNGQMYSTKAKEGKWKVTLTPVKAGGPLTLTVMDQKTKISLTDILIGDVWLAGGQSNMEFALRRVKDAQTETGNANYPQVRYYKAPRKIYAGHEPGKQSWNVCSPETAGEMSAIAYYFASGINRELKVPVGIVQCPFGGTTAEAWMSRENLLSNKDFKPIIDRYDSIISAYMPGEYDSLMVDFKAKTTLYNDSLMNGFKKAVKPVEPVGEQNFRRPYTLYENMMKPLMPFTLKGFIFYQGESNTARSYQYRTLFPTLIAEWRTGFGQGDLPFLFIQLPKFDTKTREWAELRESQYLTSKTVPNTGMVVAYDQGNPKDIHPIVKSVVGHRLTQLALGKVYGQMIICTGPEFESMKIKGNTIEIRFTNTGRGLMTSDGSDQVLGFTVCGKDGIFYPSAARIVNNRIVLTCDSVKKPVAVRYAWANSMDINLFNKEEFPAIPFRTDNFKLNTFNIN